MHVEAASNASALAGLGGKEGVTVEVLVEHGRAAIGKRAYSEAADFLSAALARQVTVCPIGILHAYSTWKMEFKLPWREAGPPDHHDDKVDSDQ